MKEGLLFCLILLIAATPVFSQQDYLKITTEITPRRIRQGSEGILKIKFTPKEGVLISSHPDFIIKLQNNPNLGFAKVFFTASELDLQTKQIDGAVYLDLGKELEIPFKVNGNSLIGKHDISGEIIYTAVFKDRWSLKTYQKFKTEFYSLKKRFKKKKR